MPARPWDRRGRPAHGWRFERARPTYCLRLDGPGLITALADEGPNVAEDPGAGFAVGVAVLRRNVDDHAADHLSALDRLMSVGNLVEAEPGTDRMRQRTCAQHFG